MQLFVLVRKSFALSSRSARRRSKGLSGGHAGGDPPVPIPNTAVKPSRADDTATARLWESRTLPESVWGSLRASPFFLSAPSLPLPFSFVLPLSLGIFISPKQIPLFTRCLLRNRYSQRSSRILDIFNSLRLEWEQDSFFPVNGDRDLEK